MKISFLRWMQLKETLRSCSSMSAGKVKKSFWIGSDHAWQIWSIWSGKGMYRTSTSEHTFIAMSRNRNSNTKVKSMKISKYLPLRWQEEPTFKERSLVPVYLTICNSKELICLLLTFSNQKDSSLIRRKFQWSLSSQREGMEFVRKSVFSDGEGLNIVFMKALPLYQAFPSHKEC